MEAFEDEFIEEDQFGAEQGGAMHHGFEEEPNWEEVEREFARTDTTGGSDGKITQVAIVVIHAPNQQPHWFEGLELKKKPDQWLTITKKNRTVVWTRGSSHCVRTTGQRGLHAPRIVASDKRKPSIKI